MQSNDDQSQTYVNQSNDQSATNQNVTVPEAAKLLGISPEAVRSRIQRGTLLKDKGPDGTVYVRLDDDQTRSTDDRSGDGSSARSSHQTQLVDSLEEQISFLRGELVTRNEELRRKDHIIAALTERIPELPAPATSSQEAPGSPRAPDEEVGKGRTPGQEEKASERRSWWRQFFGLE